MGKSERKRPLGRPGLDGRIILKYILRNNMRGRRLDWFGPVRDRDKRQSLANTLMRRVVR